MLTTADLNKESKFLTTILSRNQQPNHLINNSVVAVSNDKIHQLKLTPGDTVMVEGEKHRTFCTVVVGDLCPSPSNRVQMDRVARNNLRAHLGDVVSIHRCGVVRNGARIDVVPIDDTVQGITGNILEVYLKPYFFFFF
jgi:transitional endoplasmic reticulum ATPase